MYPRPPAPRVSSPAIDPSRYTNGAAMSKFGTGRTESNQGGLLLASRFSEPVRCQGDGREGGEVGSRSVSRSVHQAVRMQQFADTMHMKEVSSTLLFVGKGISDARSRR